MVKTSTLCRQFFIVFLQFYFVVTKNTLKHVIKAVLSKALVQRCSEIMRSKKTTQFLQENTYVGVSFLILLTVSTFAFWCYKLLLQKQPFTNDLESNFSVKFSKSTADTGVGEWGVEGRGVGWLGQAKIKKQYKQQFVTEASSFNTTFIIFANSKINHARCAEHSLTLLLKFLHSFRLSVSFLFKCCLCMICFMLN